MYPPRSEKNKQQKQKKQSIMTRFWVIVNLILILIILVLGTYFFLEERNKQASTNQLGLLQENTTTETTGVSEDNTDPVDGTDDTVTKDDDTETQTEPINSNSDEELLIHFAGDTIFSNKVATKLEQQGYDFPYVYVRDLFLKDDLTIVNLESPVTERGVEAENKTYVFKSSPKALPEMSKAGIDAVNLANNHSLDQGVEGLLDTMDHLDVNEILHVGAGKDRVDAYAPIYVERKGMRIALLGFSRVIPESDWAAGKNKAGVAITYDSKLAVASIREARQNADFVFVVVHWGKERVTVLEEHQTTLAHEYIDAGADLVIGGHPHVMQGIEKYKDKWIVYSTGNFIFSKSNDPKTWDSAIFVVSCKRDGDCNLSLIPMRTELAQPVTISSEDSVRILKEIETLSPGIMIDDSGQVHHVPELTSDEN